MITNDEVYYGNSLKCQAETIDKLKEENNKLNEEIQRLKKQYCERSDCSGRIGASKKIEELQQRIDYLERSNNRREENILNDKYEYLRVCSIIDKTTEYINTRFVAQGGFTSYEWNDLLTDILSILRGEKK